MFVWQVPPSPVCQIEAEKRICDRKTEDQPQPPNLADEQIAALIATARQVAIDMMAEIVRRVLDAALIDDRAERLVAIAEVASATTSSGSTAPRTETAALRGAACAAESGPL
jgi:hypothetical protein